jgi:hypothetical protein
MFKTFFLGLPIHHKMPLYGLFSSVHNGFLLVYYDLHIVQELKALWSSRSNLLICLLSCANNYEPHLIDNEVCGNWSFNESSNHRYVGMQNKDFRPIIIRELVDVTKQNLTIGKKRPTELKTPAMQELMQCLLHWLQWIYDQEITFKQNYNIIDNYLSMHVTEVGFDWKNSSNTVQKIKKVLYLENDVNTIDKKIVDILRTCPEQAMFLEKVKLYDDEYKT